MGYGWFEASASGKKFEEKTLVKGKVTTKTISGEQVLHMASMIRQNKFFTKKNKNLILLFYCIFFIY